MKEAIDEVINRLQIIREECPVFYDAHFKERIERDYALSFAVAVISLAASKAEAND